MFGHQTTPCEGGRKLGTSGHEADIAKQRQAKTNTRHCAIDARNHWLADIEHIGIAPREILTRRRLTGRRRHPRIGWAFCAARGNGGNIGANAKPLAGCGQDNGAHVFIRHSQCKGGAGFSFHHAGPSIHTLWPIKRDGRDAIRN